MVHEQQLYQEHDIQEIKETEEESEQHAAAPPASDEGSVSLYQCMQRHNA